jgi:cobalt-zinc-cadmium efflux system outer membrane protein
MQLVGEVTSRFIHVAADQEKLYLAKEATKLAQTTLKHLQARMKVGKNSVVEVKKAKVLLSRSRLDQEHAEHELENAKLRLASSWGESSIGFEKVDGDLFTRKAIPSYQEVIAKIDNSPSVQLSNLAQQLKKAEIRMAEASRIPDLTLGLGLRRFEAFGQEAMTLEVSMPIPVRSVGVPPLRYE